jgi:hypothetical protein
MSVCQPLGAAVSASPRPCVHGYPLPLHRGHLPDRLHFLQSTGFVKLPVRILPLPPQSWQVPVL